MQPDDTTIVKPSPKPFTTIFDRFLSALDEVNVNFSQTKDPKAEMFQTHSTTSQLFDSWLLFKEKKIEKSFAQWCVDASYETSLRVCLLLFLLPIIYGAFIVFVSPVRNFTSLLVQMYESYFGVLPVIPLLFYVLLRFVPVFRTPKVQPWVLPLTLSLMLVASNWFPDVVLQIYENETGFILFGAAFPSGYYMAGIHGICVSSNLPVAYRFFFSVFLVTNFCMRWWFVTANPIGHGALTGTAMFVASLMSAIFGGIQRDFIVRRNFFILYRRSERAHASKIGSTPDSSNQVSGNQKMRIMSPNETVKFKSTKSTPLNTSSNVIALPKLKDSAQLYSQAQSSAIESSESKRQSLTKKGALETVVEQPVEQSYLQKKLANAYKWWRENIIMVSEDKEFEDRFKMLTARRNYILMRQSLPFVALSNLISIVSVAIQTKFYEGYQTCAYVRLGGSLFIIVPCLLILHLIPFDKLPTSIQRMTSTLACILLTFATMYTVIAFGACSNPRQNFFFAEINAEYITLSLAMTVAFGIPNRLFIPAVFMQLLTILACGIFLQMPSFVNLLVITLTVNSIMIIINGQMELEKRMNVKEFK